MALLRGKLYGCEMWDGRIVEFDPRTKNIRETEWLLPRGPGAVEFSLIAMGVYLHFQQQTGRLLEEIDERRGLELEREQEIAVG